MSECFGVEIVGYIAYTEAADRSETAFGKQRNDFEGTKIECIEYMRSRNIKEVYGALKHDYDEDQKKRGLND